MTERQQLEAELAKLSAAEMAALEPIKTANVAMPALREAHRKAVVEKQKCQAKLVAAIAAERAKQAAPTPAPVVQSPAPQTAEPTQEPAKT